ncbi:uncharacterized protein LOC113848024 [Abrus precatorius]|uniref:Uncharacterized protein LOC113848024 n=1 Tax=Abrus precatorius TaxID=3816 RepID=A0A8B8JNY9_ABRPR|nr:uncharacterized protein LOC113848024 [Abrus precatorius]
MDSPKHQASRFLVAVTAVLAVLAKRASRLPRKLKAVAPATKEEWRIELRSPKKLLGNISSKTLPFVRKFKKKGEEEDWGDGGVWQKAILMGDKCEPLDFSGVIYYDSNGKQLNEIPLRSPRASPVPAYFIRHGQQHNHL